MKQATVPAQITSVEDRITGNLTMEQLGLMIIPLLANVGLYALLPTSMKPDMYKFILMFTLTVSCLLAAIRIKGKIILRWLIIIFTYNLRPRFYILDKNNLYLRETHQVTKYTDPEAVKLPHKKSNPKKLLELDEATILASRLIESSNTNLGFVPRKKGGMNVVITEVES